MVASNQLSSEATTGQTPRYATFNSTKVLLCGYPADDLKALAKAIEDEGGRVMSKLYRGSAPHVIVCGTMNDATLKEARKALTPDTPTVTRDWVDACIKQRAQVDVQLHRLKPFAGLQVTATNFPGPERLTVEAVIREGGGTYTPEMHKGSCTHLICKYGAGRKYSAALQWRSVNVVSEAWAHASLQLGYPAPEEQYKVPPKPAEGAAAQTTSTGAAAVPVATAVAPPTIPGTIMCGRGGASSSDCASRQQQPQQSDAQAATSSGQQQQQQQQQQPGTAPEQQAASRSRRSSQRLAQQATAVVQHAVDAAAAGSQEAAAAAAADGAAPSHHSSTGARLAALGIGDPDAAPMLLERVVLWWCGIPAGSNEHSELQTILHAYAGVRFPQLCDSTTHIMIGNSASVDELKAVQAFLQSCKRRVEVVSPAWLLLCQQEQRLAPADNRCHLQLSSLMRLAVGGGSGGAAAGAGTGAAASVFANAASRSTAPGGEQGSAGWLPEYWKQPPADPARLFDGCCFTLAAVQGLQPEHETALGHIRRLGGKVFTTDSTKPPPGWPQVFAVCPPSLPRDAESSLMAADKSFALVHPTCRITLHWMELCIERSMLLQATCRNPLLTPLKFAIPLRDFAGIRVAVSGYTQDQRVTIEKLVWLLGGSYCAGSMSSSRKPTHLMLPRWGPDAAAAAAGDDNSGQQQQQQPQQQQQAAVPEGTLRKVAFAQRHRLEMVVSEWLLECALEGRRVQEGLYRPAGELRQQLLAGVSSTQAGSATQLPQTQQQTQARPGAAASMAPPAAPRPQLPRPTQHSQRPPSTAADGAGAGGADGSVAAEPPKRSWFTANLVNSRQHGQQQAQQQQQQQQQQPQQPQQDTGARAPEPAAPAPCQARQPNQQQQQQQQQADMSSPRVLKPALQEAAATSPVSSSRKRRSSAGGGASKDAAPSADSGAATPGRLGGKRARSSQAQQQQQPGGSDGAAAAAAGAHHAAAAAACKPLAGSPLVDVGNVLRASPSVSGQHKAAVPGAVQHGSQGGGDDAALEGVLTVLNTLNSSKDPSLHGSQQLAADMLHQLPEQLLSGLSGGGGGGGSGGGGSGSGQAGGAGASSLRSKRSRPSGLGSRNPSANGTDEAAGGSGGAGMQDSGPAAMRPRRGGGASAAAAAAAGKAGVGAGSGMLPPARRAAACSGGSGDCIGGGGAGGGGGRATRSSTGDSGSRRASLAAAAAPADFEPSQQVGYDVGDTPEVLLAAAAGRGMRAPTRASTRRPG